MRKVAMGIWRVLATTWLLFRILVVVAIAVGAIGNAWKGDYMLAAIMAMCGLHAIGTFVRE